MTSVHLEGKCFPWIYLTGKQWRTRPRKVNDFLTMVSRESCLLLCWFSLFYDPARCLERPSKHKRKRRRLQHPGPIPAIWLLSKYLLSFRSSWWHAHSFYQRASLPLLLCLWRLTHNSVQNLDIYIGCFPHCCFHPTRCTLRKGRFPLAYGLSMEAGVWGCWPHRICS